MSTARVPLGVPDAGASTPTHRTSTRAAFAVNLGYLVWFWVMFAAGYWVYSWFDLDPGVDALADAGVLGWVALAAWGLVASLPSWFGAGFAVRALRAGGGTAARFALALNIALVAGFLALILLTG